MRSALTLLLASTALAGAAGAQGTTQAAPRPAPAQQATPPLQLTIDRFIRRGEFAQEPGPSVHWLEDGRSYLDTRPAAGGKGVDIVRVDLATGAVAVLAPASALVDEEGNPIEVEDIQLSADESKALLFHNSVRVWRTNTRGVYHVIDFATKKVTPVARIRTLQAGASAEGDTLAGQHLLGRPPSFLAPPMRSGLQMFAKFSPDGKKVAFVRDNDLFVTDLATRRETRLTTDGGPDVINGTTDWVYEEELGLKDAFRWSPDSRRLAYWRFDQSAVPAFPMVDETAGQYPSVAVLRYPKAGQPNSRVKVGVIEVAGGEATSASRASRANGAGPNGAGGAEARPGARAGATRWLDVGGDTGIYVARMEWVGNDSLAVQRLPRKQNRLDLLMLSATTGAGRTVAADRDSAYVDVEGEAVTWIDGGRRFVLRSDRSGWRQLYLYDRGGKLVKQITRDGADVLEVLAVDSARQQLYASVAAPTPTQRQVLRCPLSAGKAPCVRVTTEPGTHALDVGPGARYAVDTHTSLGVPATVTLYELPSMTRRRVLVDNAALRAKLAALTIRAPEFIKVPMPDGTVLDGYRIAPASFDSTRKYPVLMHLYGGPAAPQVNDAWGGRNYLWHQMLAQMGYVVVVVDNRGAAWRGRDFRKVTQYHLGVVESQDQIDAAKWLGRQPWVDATRIGMWGWSYGGYMTALTLSRGGDLFKAGIAVAPVSDWRYYDTIYTERFMWTPQENADGYKQSAVPTHVPGMTARLLLVHGTGDDNVHPQNSIVLANALERGEKPFVMLLYPNRTHSISGGNTQVHLYESFTRFIKENL
jgi:dipeptidyl-peptidase-4